MDISTKTIKEQIFKQLDNLKALEVFDSSYFPKIDEMVKVVSNYRKEGILSESDIKDINSYFGNEFIENTIQGYGLKKPYGYAGDFLMIDKIYTFHTSPIQKYKFWDDFFHNHSAPKAVRNRKAYFKNLVLNKLQGREQLKILNIASGPARDLLELFQEIEAIKGLNVTCVEMDKNAIEYAQNLTKTYSEHIEFINKNALRFQTDKQYDLVWSAGLFDYFDDKGFAFLLKRCKDWVKQDGEIVIGNFNENNNPTRDYMEIFGEWFLHHRTENELINLALQVGFQKEQISVGREAENVNLFLHIKV